MIIYVVRDEEEVYGIFKEEFQALKYACVMYIGFDKECEVLRVDLDKYIQRKEK